MINLKKFCRDSLKLITEPSFRSKVENGILRQQLLQMEEQKNWLEDERKRLEDYKLTLVNRVLEAQAEIRRRNESQNDLVHLLGRLEEGRRRSKEKCRQAEQQASDLMKLYVASRRLHESLG